MKLKGIKLSNMHVYWQYAIMYLIIVGIIVITLTPIYNEALSVSKRVYLQEVNHNLIRSSNDFEKKIEATWKIQNIMNANQYYTKVKLLKSNIMTSEYHVYMKLARDFFTNLCNTVGLKEESFIVFKNSGFLMTRSDSFESVNSYFSERLIYDGFKEDEIIKRIYNLDFDKTFIPTSEIYFKNSEKKVDMQDRFLTLLTSQVDESVVVGTLLCESELYKLFNIPNLPKDTIFYITDTRNNIMITKNYNQEDFVIPENAMTVKYNNEEYNVMQYKMESIGYTAVIAVSAGYFNNMLMPLKSLIIRYILIAIAVGILLSILFTLYNYMPLKKLLDIPLLAESIRKGKYTNEYICIREHMERSDSEIQKLRKDIHNMDNALRVNLFTRLLYGSVNAEEERKLAIQLIPQLSDEYRIVIIKLNILNVDLSNIDYLSFLVYDQLKHFLYPDFIFGQLDRTKTAILIPATEQCEQFIPEVIKNINRNISGSNITVSAGISEVSKGIDKINNVFYHAQFGLFENKEEYICYYTCEPDIEPLSFDLNSLQRLYELVQAGKLKEFKDKLDTISYVLMSSGNYSGRDVRKTFYIISFVLESIIKIMQCKKVVLPEYHENETIQELFKSLGAAAENIILELNERRQNPNAELMRNILNYINNNFTSNTLYASTIASDLGLSEGYIYKLVKEHTGCSLNDYIKRLRAEKAANMLEETSLPVYSISEDCGYDVLRTFYREFKKQYGVTPSEFRENKNIPKDKK